MATITWWQKLTHNHNEDAEVIRAMSLSSRNFYGLLVKAGIMCVLPLAFRIVCCLSVPISGGISPSSG